MMIPFGLLSARIAGMHFYNWQLFFFFFKCLNNILLIHSATLGYLDCFLILQSSEQSCHQDSNVGVLLLLFFFSLCVCVYLSLWFIWVNIKRHYCWIEWKACAELCKRLLMILLLSTSNSNELDFTCSLSPPAFSGTSVTDLRDLAELFLGYT